MKPHGTRSRYEQHLSDGETPCAACRADNARRGRKRNRAAQTARRQLVAAHPDEYRTLYLAALEGDTQ